MQEVKKINLFFAYQKFWKISYLYEGGNRQEKTPPAFASRATIRLWHTINFF